MNELVLQVLFAACVREAACFAKPYRFERSYWLGVVLTQVSPLVYR